MANQNPFTAPLSAIKIMGEQMNVAIQGMGTGMTRAASQTLDSLMGGLPALPGMPGGQARAAGIPTPGALLPANLAQALGSIENVLIPPGLPRPSTMLPGFGPPETTPPAEETPAGGNAGAAAGTLATRRRVAERRGM